METDEKKFLIELGQKIKSLRTAKKLTLEALCYKNGLEPSTIMRIEKAHTVAKITTLLKLSKAFGIQLPELLNIPDDSQQEI